MERQDWMLLAISFAGGRGFSPVQLQKTMFLLGKKLSDFVGEGFYTFVAHSYGPFSKDVYYDAEELERQGLLTIAKPPGQTFAEYSPTAQGAVRAQQLAEQLDPNAVERVRTLVAWVCSQSFTRLLRSIYTQFPEFRANSVFQG